MSISILWKRCLNDLEAEVSPQVFNTWLRPLHAQIDADVLYLLAPNRFVMDWVKRHFAEKIQQKFNQLNPKQPIKLVFQVGSQGKMVASEQKPPLLVKKNASSLGINPAPLNKRFTFQEFVLGDSNRLAHAASMEMVQNGQFNPLFIYGGTGLGKTHLMQAVGHAVAQQKTTAKIAYLHSERFVIDMVRALQTKAINRFKEYYRSVDVLLIDDIQFLAGKNQSQEEFFHTFNALIDGNQQIILTSDRTPKDIEGLDERLKSRLGSGLTVNINKPDIETKVNILTQKALQAKIILPEDVAVYIAENIDNSIRELEGSLHRLLASARLMQESITLDFSRHALKDLIKPKIRLIHVGQIQQTVADYYHISVSDLLSQRRHRHIARPRQMAMLLCRELTSDNYPTLGRLFGNRDRTTVLHACKTIVGLKLTDSQLNQDYSHLVRLLA